MRKTLSFPLLLLVLASLASCSRPDVVIYCSADQAFAEPLLDNFAAQTGLKVRAVFDVEAAKTVGLVRTLFEETGNPQCDVFWNSEIVHTIRLKQAGALATYVSPAAADIPKEFKDSENQWTGFAARTRVFIINTNLMKPEEYPKTVADLTNPKWKGKVGIARPLAGTTLTHFAVLFELWGEEKAKEFCYKLLANDINLASGNAHVARLVADGQLAFALTDTDDYESQKAAGKPVAMVYPDADGIGSLMIPNTISLIAGSPHPENGKKLIDALLAHEVERKLAFSDSANVPVRESVEAPPHVLRISKLRRLDAPFGEVAKRYDARLEILKSLFLK